MKKLFVITVIIFSNIVCAQEKTYRFLYDFHQKGKLTTFERVNNSPEFAQLFEESKNRSYEIEVIVNRTNSLIKILEKVNNSQEGFFSGSSPLPKWLLVDFVHNLTFEEKQNLYVQDSISTLQLTPTRNTKTILGIKAKEFTYENDDYTYSFWLAKQNEITVSPIYFQFNGYVLLEASINDKAYEKEGGERKLFYVLKEIKEQDFNFNKIIPKKSISILEYNKKMEQLKEDSRGVERD